MKHHYYTMMLRAQRILHGEHRSLLTNKSLIVWILGFCTFITALTTFHAILLQTQYGPTATFETYFLSPFTGPIQVITYFWASLVLTCALFGATSFAAFRYSLEFDTLIKLNSVLNHNTKQLTTLLSENNKAMEEFRQNLSQSMDTEIDNLRLEVKAQIAKQQEIIQTVEKQAKITIDTQRKLKALEKRLNPKPKVALNDKPQKIKGIGPRLAQKTKKDRSHKHRRTNNHRPNDHSPGDKTDRR